jgi:uncharacterized protein with von Willebrand factor type A (vWA) domain
LRIRYTTWDGTQKVVLDADRLFERLAGHLSDTDDVGEALQRLLQEGMGGDGFDAVGTDDLADRVREAIQQLYDRYNLTRSLEQPWNDADDVVALEEEAARRKPSAAERKRRAAELEALSRFLEERLAQLADRHFDDDDARSQFEGLAERAGDIASVERFQRRFREQFQGPESPGFDETLELIERLENLRRLEKALRDGELDGLDEEALGEQLGEDFAEALGRLKQIRRLLAEAGYLVQKGGRVALSPKAARRLGRLALKEVLAELLADTSGRHDTQRRGPSEATTESARPYQFGDPMTIDVAATLKAALTRRASTPRSEAGSRALELEPGDLHVKESRRATRTSTVLLLDMSWSMSWEGRFAAAKKVALAMETLMRTRFPRDFFGMVGFYTRAVELKPSDLAEVTWNMGDPFTNLQDGLRLASRLLDRHPAATRQMIVITDGQPTAYFADERLICEWPMGSSGISSRATAETLKEVERVTRKGVRINTFMLDDTPLLRAFVQRMTAINRGRAFYTTPDQLGHFVLVDHVGKRRKFL